MPLPHLEGTGDLPEGVHRATLAEMLALFGNTQRRQLLTARLLRIYQDALSTGGLERFIVFGSFVTAKPDPNDIDIVLIMRDDFDLSICAVSVRKLFHHLEAQEEYGASIFWMRPSMLILETIDEFLAHWQVKRDGTGRGVIEITT